MTSKTRRRHATEHGADPWWGIDDAARDQIVPPAPSAASRQRHSRRSSGAGRAGWLLVGLLVAPFDLLRRRMAHSVRLRRVVMRIAVVGAVLTVLACSVGVILINNVVIGRTAELGELDDRRRELRRENALLSAQAARLSSPDVVYRRATKELGMVPTDDVPQFIYLVPGSRTLTPWQRDRLVTREARRRAKRAATAEAAATADASTTDPAAASSEVTR